MPRTNPSVLRIQRSLKNALIESGVSSGTKLIVAVSGGPDSLTLLYALHQLSTEFNLVLHAAHLNHGFRGVAADSDADFVNEVCNKIGVELSCQQSDVFAYRKAHRLSIEQAAREVRYAFLAKTAVAQGADIVTLGHTFDDQAETVLMHILRGTGLTGLRGMQRMSKRVFDNNEIALFRPLLETSREDTLLYCTTFQLLPREDETNYSHEFNRNRIRHDLIPYLKQYNPAIKEALVRLSRGAQKDLQYLESNVDHIWNQIAQVVDSKVTINRGMFLWLEPALQTYLLRRALCVVKGGVEDIQQIHIDAMTKLMSGPAGRSIDLPGQIHFVVSYDQAELASSISDSVKAISLTNQFDLLVPGETTAGPWSITATIVENPYFSTRTTQSELNFRRTESGPEGTSGFLKLASVGSRLSVRTRRPSDRFQPLGMSQSKKLQDFMVDAKIPRHSRDSVPLITTENGIAWVVGWRIADWAKLTSEDKRCLQLRFISRENLSV